MDENIPYLLLTPGPLTTSKRVKQVMLNDFCTWDDDYNSIVTGIRRQLTRLATATEDYTSVLMQGSGTFAVEATIGSVVPHDGKLLVLNNGAYGKRIVQIAQRLRINGTELYHQEVEPTDAARMEEVLANDLQITHVAMVHCETTTGMLNDAAAVGQAVRRQGRVFILDAMSSFGGIPMSMEELGAHYLVSSANKCIQGVPGFGFVIAERKNLLATVGEARSLSLDLHDQWQEMEDQGGKWRYTSPTHTVRAFAQALLELEEEGGVAARHARYVENHRRLVAGMQSLGFRTLLPTEFQSPIITAFVFPDDERFEFAAFYEAVKRRRFVIYPGKVSQADTFRIGNIGHVFPDDIDQLCGAIGEALDELGIRL